MHHHAGTGLLLKLVVAPLLTHDLAQVQAVHPALQPGDVLVADRGLCSYAHLAFLVQADLHAVRRVGARPMVGFTPGRPLVMPGGRRTTAVKGLPRSRWLNAKELTICAIVYNLIRMVMWQSAALQHIAVERISFRDGLRWLGAPSTGMP